MENAPLLTGSRAPNDPDDEEALFDGGSGVAGRGPRTREAPRDHKNFFPLRHGEFSHRETLLAFTCVVLLILMSVFAGLYASGRTNKHPPPPPVAPPPIIVRPNDTTKVNALYQSRQVSQWEMKPLTWYNLRVYRDLALLQIV